MVAQLAHLVCLMALASAEPRPLPQVVADLGSRDYAVREAASGELRVSKAYTLASIEGALKDTALSAEQRHRLELAGLTLFKDAPHGALGVEFTSNPDIAEIKEVKPWFPSAATLKAGDVITQIDGEPVTTRTATDQRTSTVRSMVVSHEPGDEVPVTVLRDGKPVELLVKFGDFNELNRDLRAPNANVVMRSTGLFEAEYQAAWRHRLKRKAGNTVAPIDATALRGTQNTGWNNDPPSDPLDSVNAARAANGEIPSVTAGARPDQTRQLNRIGQTKFGGDQGWGGGAGFAGPFGNNGPGAGGQPDLSNMTDKELAEDRLTLSRSLSSIAMITGQPNLSRAQRRQFAEIEALTVQQLSAVNREIEKRKAARQEAELAPVAPVAPPVPVAPDVKP